MAGKYLDQKLDKAINDIRKLEARIADLESRMKKAEHATDPHVLAGYET